MSGAIRTFELCPKCHGKFASIPHPVIPKEQVDLICLPCMTRPVKVYIDGRGLRDKRGEAVGYIACDRNGEPFMGFHAAHLTISTIRKQKKEGTLDAREWQADKAKKYLLPDMRDEYVSALLRGGRSRGHRNQAERVLDDLVGIVGSTDCRYLPHGFLSELDALYAKAGISGRARMKYLHQVQAFLRWMNKYHIPYRQRVEIPPLPMIEVVRKEIGWIDTPEQETVLAAIPYPELHLAFRVLFCTGARIGEICALKKKDIVMDGGIPFIYAQRAVDAWGKVKETKTGIWMRKPVPMDVYQALEDRCRDKFPESFIWLTRYGNPYSPQRLSTLWHRAAEKTGLNVSLYAACRHSRATKEIRKLQGKMLQEVANLLGDSVKIAKGYIRPISEQRFVETSPKSHVKQQK